MIVYVTYRLLNIAGEGHTPAHQVMQTGAILEASPYEHEGRLFGYLLGTNVQIGDALGRLGAWGARELTEMQALDWAERSLPVNSFGLDDKYVGPAVIGPEGKIQRDTLDTPYPVGSTGVIYFQGQPVGSAEDVDRVTIERIKEMLRPGVSAELQLGEELKQLKEALGSTIILLLKPGATPAEKAAAEAKIQTALVLEAEGEVIRQEGRDFKAAQGW